MNETLQEFVDSRGVAVRVDRELGILRGVKILGLQSRNGRRYLPEAMAKAAGLYAGARVNVNHPKGNPAGPRDYQDRIGVIREVVVRDDGLFADFHFNPKHLLAEQLLWDAEHAPENVGFSHNVLARTAQQGDQTVVEDILRVQSVDLVADPATTRGLFEGTDGTPSPETQQQVLEGLTVQQLRQHRPELIQEVLAEQDGELQRLRAELQQLEEAEMARQQRAQMKRLLSEFQLPDPDSRDPKARAIVGPRFVDQLLASPDQQAMRELVEERARLVRASGGGTPQVMSAGSPLSREQSLIDPAHGADAKTFVKAIT